MPTLERKTGRKVTKLSGADKFVEIRDREVAAATAHYEAEERKHDEMLARGVWPAGNGDAAEVIGAAIPDALAPPTPDQLLLECATQSRLLQKTIQATLESGQATPALVRESAGLTRSIAILSKELRDREKATKDKYRKLSDREKEELTISMACSARRQVQVEIHRRLSELLGKGEP